ncbi:LysE family translocator [Micromonospora krabiensis]|uniref:Threonine/homoserine/homoserine lactone efflux protein n=1 Tax=Micromonospora krabiensis TaxID=307121 RepID=A0A1C3MX89_9ACTN|nr:LysE family translocator [Micromonospora krabiensis]SBV24924.1 Threonine/homoserine/homoserine lactone efflux protein [Micromonospora krabiensis]
MGLAFWITTLVVVVTPGAGVAYTLSEGLSRGARAGLVAAVGCTLGTVPHLLAAVTGLAALLAASATAFRAVQYVGVAYLLFLAWSTLRDRSAFSATEAPPRSAVRVIVGAILVNLLNPKPTLFFVAFLPQFVDPTSAGATAGMLTAGAVFMLLTLVVFGGYGVAAGAVRDRVLARPRVTAWLRRTIAGTFVALGVSLLLSER